MWEILYRCSVCVFYPVPLRVSVTRTYTFNFISMDVLFPYPQPVLQGLLHALSIFHCDIHTTIRLLCGFKRVYLGVSGPGSRVKALSVSAQQGRSSQVPLLFEKQSLPQVEGESREREKEKPVIFLNSGRKAGSGRGNTHIRP